MEPSQNIAGDPADAYTHLQTSGETSSIYNNDGLYRHTPRSSLSQLTHNLSHSDEPVQLHENGPLSQYNQYSDNAVLSDARPNHPLTPPAQVDEEQRLREWYARQNAQQNSVQYHAPFPVAHYSTPTARSSYADPLGMPPPQPRLGYIPSWPLMDNFAPVPMLEHSNDIRRLQNLHLPPYAASAQHHARGYQDFQAQNNLEQLRDQVPSNIGPRIRFQEQNAQRRLPPIGSSQPPPTQQPYELIPASSPLIQEYSTNSVFQQNPSRVTPPRPRVHSSHDGPSPGHDGITPPDKMLKQKKEAYRRKAEEVRLRRQTTTAKRATAKRPDKSTTAKRTKRKTANRSDDVGAPTLSPSHRPSKLSKNHFTQTRDSCETSSDPSPYITPHQHHYQQNMNFSAAYTFQEPFGKPVYYNPVKIEPGIEETHTLETDHDETPQKIMKYYQYYSWSVTLYEVDHNGQYDYAHSWLEDLFASNLPPDKYRWESHTTCGFIKNGGRLSFLAIHNAADPFSTNSIDSTTSIGAYGYYWYNHDEIHWKTFGPDIRWLLDWCVANNGITVKHKWKVDMPKASDRRFHRAYWLAANRKHLNNLLNHSEDIVDTPQDVAEEVVDDGSEVGSEDLTNEWDVTMKEAEKAWKEVLDENERRGNEGAFGYQHIVTGRSEGW